MTTHSTEQAMVLLESKRRELIEAARVIAVDLINRDGFTHSRAVRAEMQRRGLLDGYDGGDYWLGAVFRPKDMFESAGRWYEYTDKSRNIHERRVHVWKLKGGVKVVLPPPPEPQQPPQWVGPENPIEQRVTAAAIAVAEMISKPKKKRARKLPHPDQLQLKGL